VTAQRATPAGRHKLFKFDATGAYRAQYDQPAATDASQSGIHDLAYDRNAQVLYGGCEHAASGRKVFAFDLVALRFDPAKEWIVPAAAPGTAVRALAFDPFGNGLQGSLWSGDLGSPVYEFARDGTLLRQLPNVNPLATGAALDATQRVVWWFGQAGTARPNCGVAGVALDLLTGTPNGQVFLGDLTLPGVPAGGLAAGAEFVTYDHFDHVVTRLVLVAQAQSHHVYELEGRFHSGTPCGGRIGCRGDAAFVGNAGWTITLAGSGARNAALLLSTQGTTLPLPTPLFAPGCYLLASLAAPSLVLPPLAVQNGAAALNVPITLGGGVDLYWQWIELPAAGALTASDGGAIWLVP
jgi:hypothetical protein